jgi:lactate dehydrogenase-like 2-hydroxyacid dehydrogenase
MRYSELFTFIVGQTPHHFTQMIERGDWQVSQVARSAFDLEGKVVGTIGAGRIGFRILQRVLPFNVKENLYYDYAELKPGKPIKIQF